MGVPRHTALKIPPAHPELGVMLPGHSPDIMRTSTFRVWSGIWTMIKYVLLFCLGMVVGAVFLQSDNVEKRCFESMVAIGFSPQRGREICFKHKPNFSVPPTRFDCMPRNAHPERCLKKGCIWDESVQNAPYCFYPDKYGSYSNENITTQSGRTTAFMRKRLQSPYPEDADLLKFVACGETEDRLHIRITDAKKMRFEPFYPKVPISDCEDFNNKQYLVKISEGKMGFKVLRSTTKKVIFDSENIGGFTYANQFLQLNAKLSPGSLLYGIGERHGPLNIDTNFYQTFTLWNRDVAPAEKKNLYGSHPFILIRDQSVHNDSKWHGLFLLNSNAMDIITQPGPAITFRTIGGILDFYWFMGDSPSKVTQQYLEVIGHPRMPPYWALGFHLCKFGYGSLKSTYSVWNRTRSAGIPFDVQWNDLDYMDKNNDFTINPKFNELPKFVKMLHSVGMHYIPLIDPGVSAGEPRGAYPPYDLGVELGIFVADENNNPFVGKVWNRISTVWPDFTNPKTFWYWNQLLQKLHNVVPFDGIWIDMNEPSNFYSGTSDGCPENSLNYPPYIPNVVDGQLFNKTLCPSAKHYKGVHYNLHNLYGISEAVVTSSALEHIREEKRPVVISRSTFPGHGQYAFHWTGDVFSTWSDMKLSVAQILNFNMFGIPFVGADICGFNGNTTKELCARWSQLGAFYPFSRNHNSDDTIEQDPVSLGPIVVNAARKALEIRYSLLPYLYYLFFDAVVHGKTVARPLFYEFPNDANTHVIEKQFMWGACIMFVPVVDEGKTTVEGYFPAGRWYDWYSSKALDSSKPLSRTLEAPLDVIPLFVRAGCILPTQEPKLTTTESRQTPFTLRVYLDLNGSSEGSVYIDDGEDNYAIKNRHYSLVSFSVKDNTLLGSVKKSGFSDVPYLNNVLIYGECNDVTIVTVNGKKWDQFSHDKESCSLSVSVNTTMLLGIRMKWQTSTFQWLKWTELKSAGY